MSLRFLAAVIVAGFAGLVLDNLIERKRKLGQPPRIVRDAAPVEHIGIDGMSPRTRSHAANRNEEPELAQLLAAGLDVLRIGPSARPPRWTESELTSELAQVGQKSGLQLQ